MGTKRKKRVLAIDDEPAMTDWLKVVLEHAGYEVRTALIGVRGEELFKTWRPDAVLTDMMLPDVDGIELVRRFKELNPQSEVVVVSGQGNIPRAVEAIKAGASYFLEKPIDADGMLALLEKAIERTDLHAENRELKAKLARSLQVRQHHRPQQEDGGAVRAGRERGRQRSQHPHPGRQRHRQGADRQRDPLQQQAVEGPVHQDQLRGDPEGPD